MRKKMRINASGCRSGSDTRRQRLGVRNLAGLPGNAGQSVVTVRTDVRRFDLLPGVHAALDVVWSLVLGNPRSRTRR